MIQTRIKKIFEPSKYYFFKLWMILVRNFTIQIIHDLKIKYFYGLQNSF